MKTQINLLAADPEAGRPFSWAVALAYGLALLLFCALGVGSLVEWRRTQSLQGEVVRLEARKARLNGMLEASNQEVEAIFGRQAAFFKHGEGAQRRIREIQEHRTRWSAILQELSLLTPQRVWLTRVETLKETAAAGADNEFREPYTAIRLEGFAGEPEWVVQFLNALGNAGTLKNPRLVYSRRGDPPQNAVVTFEIVAELTRR